MNVAERLVVEARLESLTVPDASGRAQYLSAGGLLPSMLSYL